MTTTTVRESHEEREFSVRPADPGRGRGQAAPHRRRRWRGRRPAAHLRGAALLRAAGGRAHARRGAGHRGAHLRHLPGRLPDVRRARLRVACRVWPWTRRSDCCAACSTAGNGSRATRCTSSCCTHPTSSVTRARWRWRPIIATLVERGLRMKKLGNRIVAIVGGRAIHPVSVRVGGFSRVPRTEELEELRAPLREALADAQATVALVASLDTPVADRDTRLVSLRHPDEYPMNDGRIVSSDGIDLAPGEWRSAFHEEQVPWSHALQARAADGVPYLLGPTARVVLAADQLHPLARAALEATGLTTDDLRRNVFRSIVSRAVELVHALAEAAEIVEAYRRPARPAEPWEPRPGVAAWATEAPRGLLFHRYELDADGHIRAAQIVPPTSQNQAAIEHDLEIFAPAVLDLPHEEATLRLEQLIRSYDPCISLRDPLPGPHHRARTVSRRVRILACGSPDGGDDAAGLEAAASAAAGGLDRATRGAGRAALGRAAAGRRAGHAAPGGRLRRRAASRRAGRPAARRPAGARGRASTGLDATPSPSGRRCALAGRLGGLHPGDRFVGIGGERFGLGCGKEPGRGGRAPAARRADRAAGPLAADLARSRGSGSPRPRAPRRRGARRCPPSIRR